MWSEVPWSPFLLPGAAGSVHHALLVDLLTHLMASEDGVQLPLKVHLGPQQGAQQQGSGGYNGGYNASAGGGVGGCDFMSASIRALRDDTLAVRGGGQGGGSGAVAAAAVREKGAGIGAAGAAGRRAPAARGGPSVRCCCCATSASRPTPSRTCWRIRGCCLRCWRRWSGRRRPRGRPHMPRP